MRNSLVTLLATAALAGACPAQFTLSEMLINAPGIDNGQEAIEIRGPANTKLTGYSFLAIEGDGANAGVVDQAIDLGSYSTGSNGLLLIRDTSAVLQPPPESGTSVVVFNPTPDIENGTTTFVLGRGTAPARNTDLDTNNDGKLDSGIPGFTVVDAVAWTDGGSSDHMYATQLNGFEFPDSNVYTPDCGYRIYDAAGNPFCWTAADVTSPGTTGPYSFDFARNRIQGGLAKGFGPQAMHLGGTNGRLSMCADAYGISLAQGGKQNMTVDAGAGNAGNFALFLGCLSGTQPGVKLGPNLTLPLNIDAYLLFIIAAPNALLVPSVAILDNKGQGATTLTLPANAPLPAKTILNHAALVIRKSDGAMVFASTPTTVFMQ